MIWRRNAGGNCDITEIGKTVVKHGVTIIGAINLGAGVPYHASMMYARNITAFLTHLIKDQKMNLNLEDEIVRETLLTSGGEIVQARVREFLQIAGAGQGSELETKAEPGVHEA